MSRLPSSELLRLRMVAGEIVATLEAHGFEVGKALSLHAAFREGRGPSSALERALVKEGAQRGGRKAGMFAEPVNGGLDLVSITDITMRRYRLKTATYRSGVPHIVCGEGSSLISAEEEPGLYRVERWVLACGTDGDHTVETIFAAEIVGHEGDGPVHLILGPLYPLDPITDPEGFAPGDDDDLGDGFPDDDEGDGDSRPKAV